MAGIITITEDSRTDRDAGYLVRLDDDPYLFLYLTRTTYVLAWDGNIKYEQLATEALRTLPATFQESATPAIVDAAYIVKADNNALQRFSESPAATIKRFQALGPSTITFARYDIRNGPQFSYGVTAVNPLYDPDDPEIAIQRPRKGITEATLDWIINHHERHFSGETKELLTVLQTSIMNAFPKE